MIKHPLKTTAGIVAVLVLTFTLISHRAVSSKQEVFDQANAETLIRYGTAQINAPKAVEVERVVLVIPPEAPLTVPIAKPAKKEKIESNTCTRHNMRKITYGRRWRCKK
jgi:hypothetical protein